MFIIQLPEPFGILFRLRNQRFFATDLVNICCFLLILSSTEYSNFEALLLDDLLTGV